MNNSGPRQLIFTTLDPAIRNDLAQNRTDRILETLGKAGYVFARVIDGHLMKVCPKCGGTHIDTPGDCMGPPCPTSPPKHIPQG